MMSVRRLPLPQEQAQDLAERQQRLAGCLPYDDRVDQEWNRFRGNPRKHVLRVLRRQHMWRCVYCETPGCAETVEHYYPKKQFPGHTFEWANLSLACGACQSFKVEPLQFAGVWPLMIDPTNEELDTYLYVSPHNGRIIPALHLCRDQLEWKRATETIARLRLNERSLPHQRKRVALELRDALQDYQENPCRKTENQVLRKVGRGQPWPAVARQIVREPEGEYRPMVAFCLENSPRIRRYLEARNWLM